MIWEKGGNSPQRTSNMFMITSCKGKAKFLLQMLLNISVSADAASVSV